MYPRVPRQQRLRRRPRRHQRRGSGSNPERSGAWHDPGFGGLALLCVGDGPAIPQPVYVRLHRPDRLVAPVVGDVECGPELFLLVPLPEGGCGPESAPRSIPSSASICRGRCRAIRANYWMTSPRTRCLCRMSCLWSRQARPRPNARSYCQDLWIKIFNQVELVVHGLSGGSISWRVHGG